VASSLFRSLERANLNYWINHVNLTVAVYILTYVYVLVSSPCMLYHIFFLHISMLSPCDIA
jgi:hypothetical protein